MKNIIGRRREIFALNQILSSKKAEFVAVYGRRRVGKTYLIQQTLSHKEVYMECTGLKDGNLHTQLNNFIKSFEKTFYPTLSLHAPQNWQEAFELVTREIKKIPKSKKIILFFDELPWLATKKSGLLQALDYCWNTQWSRIPNFKLVVCGSAASWMLNYLINAKGGLYNRITKSLLLAPFTLEETKQFLESKKLKLTEKQILDVYMVMGGVPYYLNQIQATKSLAQNIDDICFRKDGLLYAEFPRLFKSLFDAVDLNLHIVREIAKHRYGISFIQLIKKTGKKTGGRFKERLAELEAAGFIQSFLPYGRKKRDHYYRVIDEYTLFYLKWIQEIINGRSLPKSGSYWTHKLTGPAWQSWAGYAFEGICYKHADKVIKALGIEGIGCLIGNWRCIPPPGQKEQGAQIDLLLDRDDGAISLCEIKYSTSQFSIDKSYAKNLANKMEIFREQNHLQKQIFWVVITTVGLKRNIWSEDLISDVVLLKDLF